MKIFSYVLNHDYGLAPNPFGSYCTLAVCKQLIRKNKNLKIGDWVIGTAGKNLGEPDKLIYAMKVEEKLTYEAYWADPRFEYKKPIINGSLVQMYGDNFYHKDKKTGEWIQENSAHSRDDSIPNLSHLNTDTSGEYVLISQHYYYWGDQAPIIPAHLSKVIHQKQGFKYKKIPQDIREFFIEWLKNYELGLHGSPISWKTHLK